MPPILTLEEKAAQFGNWLTSATPSKKEKLLFLQTSPLDTHKYLLPQALKRFIEANRIKIYANKLVANFPVTKEFLEGLDFARYCESTLDSYLQAAKEIDNGSNVVHIFLVSPFELKVLAEVLNWRINLAPFLETVWNNSKDRTIAIGCQNPYNSHTRQWFYYRRPNGYMHPYYFYNNLNSYFYNEGNSGSGYLDRWTYYGYTYEIPYKVDTILSHIL